MACGGRSGGGVSGRFRSSVASRKPLTDRHRQQQQAEQPEPCQEAADAPVTALDQQPDHGDKHQGNRRHQQRGRHFLERHSAWSPGASARRLARAAQPVQHLARGRRADAPAQASPRVVRDSAGEPVEWRISPARGGRWRASSRVPASSAMTRASSSTEVAMPVQTLNTGASGGREPHRRQQRRDDIGDVDEVARLPAVAEDVDRRAAADALAEDRDHAGIGRARVLARPVHVEEAQPDGGDAVHVAGDAGMQLAAKLVGAVGGERATFGRLR